MVRYKKFRFKNYNEAHETLISIRNGGSASPAILRELEEFIRLGKDYPFKER